jgi:hypothetical protein
MGKDEETEVGQPTVAAGKKSARWPTLQDILLRSSLLTPDT